MSVFFPHVDIQALRQFASTAASKENDSTGDSIRIRPRVVSCRDVVWVGEKMILINFDPNSMSAGPQSMLAHFPRGRPRLTTQSLVGMTLALRDTGIRAPKIYDYKDYTPNRIGAEVVLLEKVPGDTLESLWPTLTESQVDQVLRRLSELLLQLFNHRSAVISSCLYDRRMAAGAPASSTAGNQEEMVGCGFLLARPFDEGPFEAVEPQSGLRTVNDYLSALAKRIYRLFAHMPPDVLSSGPPDHPYLTSIDISRILATWQRLETLIAYNTGGFYIPDTVSLSARQEACRVLQSQQFGVLHTDMRMCRFILEIKPNDEIVLTLTGWEHAYHAPLWSCTRFPPWLTPSFMPDSFITPDRQKYLRRRIWEYISGANSDNPPIRRCENYWEWITGYVYGFTERWFEGCLSSHWRDYCSL